MRDRLQVFESILGYVPTALIALTLDDAERLWTKLNARIGLSRDPWMAVAAKAMIDGFSAGRSSIH